MTDITLDRTLDYPPNHPPGPCYAPGECALDCPNAAPVEVPDVDLEYGQDDPADWPYDGEDGDAYHAEPYRPRHAAFTVWVSACGPSRPVTFATDDQAVAWITSHGHLAIHLDEATTSTVAADAFPGAMDLLYPTCEHGLSQWLCEGPQHYPADTPWS